MRTDAHGRYRCAVASGAQTAQALDNEGVGNRCGLARFVIPENVREEVREPGQVINKKQGGKSSPRPEGLGFCFAKIKED